MKSERLSATQVRPLGLNKPSPFEYSYCVKVEGHDHIKAFNVVKKGDVIRHRNDSSKEAHARAAIKIVGSRNVAQMFLNLNIQLIVIGDFYGCFDESLRHFLALRQDKVSYIAINLFHDFVERRCLLCIFSEGFYEVDSFLLDFLYCFFVKVFLIDFLYHTRYSGVSFNRPNFKKLEDAIRKGAIDCIVVKDLSRFSRNYIDGGRYLEKIFPQLGIRFIAVNDAYDSLTGDPQSDSFVILFKNLINDSYCKDISMKIRSSLEVKQKNGEFVGAFAPYGYKKSPENKNQLVVDEAVSEYVQMIFALYKDGISIGRIAARLNQMGVLSPMEYKHSAGVKFDTVFKTGDTAKWTYKAVQRILTNEVYIGVLAQGKRGTPNYKVRVVQPKDETEWVKVEGAHEALVSYEDFMAVKTMMKRDMRCSPDQEEAHLFSGFLFCADCQQSMIRKTVPSKTKKYIYYVCSSNKHNQTCSPHSISAKEVEEKVFHAIHDQIELVVNLEKALALIERLPSQNRKAFNYEAQITKLEEEIERYQKLKLRLYEDLSDGIIDKSEYFEFRNSYTKIIEEKQEALHRVKKEMKQSVTTGTSERNWVTLFKQYENIEELNRRVLMALVDRILIYENHAIEIVFKYKDEYQQTLEYVLGYADELAIAG